MPLHTTAQVNVCGEIASDHFGPFDYRTISPSNLSLVERNHFNSNVESLLKGQTSTIGGDLSYTLRSIPNHPRALAAVSRLARKEKRATPIGSLYSVDCWFERAMRFAPDDPTIRLVLGIELSKDGKHVEAIQQLNIALEASPDNANVHYNLGLAYLSLKKYDESLVHARRAYELGFPLPGLRDRLVRAGVWKN
jgi:tetratricopeptide (TPR) repeat protein